MSWVTCEFPEKFLLDEYVVRRFDIADAQAVVDAVTISLAELLPWMPWAKFEPQSVAQREELIATWMTEWVNKENFAFGAFQGNTLVASTGLHLRGEVGECEIGYWVSTPYTGRGVATRVSRALTDIAFSCSDVNMVNIAHDVANVKSGRIPARLGFQISREFERPIEASGETGTIRLWSISRDEWISR